MLRARASGSPGPTARCSRNCAAGCRPAPLTRPRPAAGSPPAKRLPYCVNSAIRTPIVSRPARPARDRHAGPGRARGAPARHELHGAITRPVTRWPGPVAGMSSADPALLPARLGFRRAWARRRGRSHPGMPGPAGSEGAGPAPVVRRRGFPGVALAQHHGAEGITTRDRPVQIGGQADCLAARHGSPGGGPGSWRGQPAQVLTVRPAGESIVTIRNKSRAVPRLSPSVKSTVPGRAVMTRSRPESSRHAVRRGICRASASRGSATRLTSWARNR